MSVCVVIIQGNNIIIMATNSNNNRKRPFGATFRTLNDITNNTEFDDDSAIVNSGSNIAVKHIEGLPNDKAAAAILRRIHSEFHTIIERRGWNVTSITEMCCCGDGIGCLKKRKTKTKVMPNNVLGYNRTSTSHRGKIHDIHLRLRHPGSHDIVDYESIAATMCHELVRFLCLFIFFLCCALCSFYDDVLKFTPLSSLILRRIVLEDHMTLISTRQWRRLKSSILCF